MAKWLDKYEQGGMVLKQKTKDNYGKRENANEGHSTAGPGWIGEGYSTTGRDYSPAWGGQFQNGGLLNKLENSVNSSLGYPMDRASKFAKVVAPEKKYNRKSKETVIVGRDNIRHPFAGRATAEAIQDKFSPWMQYTGIPQLSGFVGATALGIGHELGTFINDPRPTYTKLRESGEDIFNNTVGAFVGSLPISSESKTNKLLELSNKHKLPDGFVSKNYQMGGALPGATGHFYARYNEGGAVPGDVDFSYPRTINPAPANGKYTKKTLASAQAGKKLIDFGKFGETPEMQNVYEGDVNFFNPKDFEGIRGKVENYMRSDTYLNRLNKYVPDEQFARRMRDARANSVGSVRLAPNNDNSEIGFYGNYDDPTKSNVPQTYNDHTIRYNDKTTRSVMGHEIGHAVSRGMTHMKGYEKSGLVPNAGETQAIVGGIKTDELLKNYPTYANDNHYTTKGGTETLSAAGETYGDLTGLRLILNDSGITKKFGDELTPEMFKKALENPKTKNDPVLKRMKMKFSDEDIVRMNNEVADNNKYNKSITAQSGIKAPPQNPTLKRIEEAKLKIQASQDAKTLSKGEYEAKYKGTSFDNYKWWKDDNVAGWETQVKNLQKNYDTSIARQKAAEQAAIDLENKQKAERLQKETFVNEYSSKQSEFDKFKSDIASKYKYTPGEQILSPHDAIVKRMTDEANKAIETGIGYDLPQYPGNEMTCINGVCEIASTAGVDFSGMEGVIGVRKNPYTGKVIPQYNEGWAANDNYKKAGYNKLAEGEIPQVGDLAQYTDNGKIHHMELVLGSDKGGINTYNNYQQTLTPVPGAGKGRRNFDNTPNKMTPNSGAGVERTVYYRLDPSVEQKIYDTNPEYTSKVKGKQQFESSDDFKKYNEYQDYINKQSGTYNQYKDYLSKLPKGKAGIAIKDDRGQWAHPGEITEIGSNDITMQGVDYPVLGISDTGDTQMMYPNQDYKFDGEKVTEIPMMQGGGVLSRSDLERMAALQKNIKNQKIRNAQETISQYTPKPGDQERMNAAKDAYRAEEAKPLNRLASNPHMAKAWDNIVEPMMDIEAGVGAAQLVKAGAKALSKKIGKKAAKKVAQEVVGSNPDMADFKALINWPNRSIDATVGLADQVRGELLLGSKNRAAIKEGNDWLKAWVEHPVTQNKVTNGMADAYWKSGTNDLMNESKYMQNTMYMNSYVPRATEYPLSNQFADWANVVTGSKNSRHIQPIHGGLGQRNLGVSYGHSFSPAEEAYAKANPDLERILHEKQQGARTWISRSPEMSQADRTSTTIHEGAHDWLKSDVLNDPNVGYAKHIEKALDPDVMKNTNIWKEATMKGEDISKLMDKEDAYKAYLGDGTEVHARIMELRKEFGINPYDKITTEKAEEILKKVKSRKSKINYRFADIIKDPKSLADLFNILPASGAAAVGIDAVTKDEKKQKNGGWLNKYK